MGKTEFLRLRGCPLSIYNKALLMLTNQVGNTGLLLLHLAQILLFYSTLDILGFISRYFLGDFTTKLLVQVM